MSELHPDLAQILAQARRIAGPALPWRTSGQGEEQCLVFEIVADDAVVSRRLTNALYAFCDQVGLKRRFLVVRSTTPKWGTAPPVPDAWPP